MSNRRYRVGDRVLVMGPPPDVQYEHDQSVKAGHAGRGAHLWTDLPATVVERQPSDDSYWNSYNVDYDNENAYRVILDADLEAAAEHGWITNNFFIHQDNLIPERVPENELAEALASIQATAQKRNDDD